MKKRTDKHSGWSSFFRKLFFLEKPAPRQVEQIHTKSSKALDSAKQEKLQRLCEDLFKKKELITSGKLQFIGLSKIKKHMGSNWKNLCQIVYDTTERAIDKYTEKGDTFIRYKDDSYILIFARAGLEEGRMKAALIAEEIRRQLFECGEEELKKIEIREAVAEIRTDVLAGAGTLNHVYDMVDENLGDLKNAPPAVDLPPPAPAGERPFAITSIEVDPASGKRKAMQGRGSGSNIECGYLPLWDTKAAGLTTYLCLARRFVLGRKEDDLFGDYLALYRGVTDAEQASIDCAILEETARELKNMEDKGLGLSIVCPVCHNTLYNTASFETYKNALSNIPLHHRKNLSLLVTSIPAYSLQDPYGFVGVLRAFCRAVFVEVPLRPAIDLGDLKNSGIDVVGVRLAQKNIAERHLVDFMNNFCRAAQAVNISRSFVLDIPSLSLTTSAVCAGFDFLGGPAIHGRVDHPDTGYDYRYAALIKGFKT